MEMWIRNQDQELMLDVPKGMSIAAAARRDGMELFGPCKGEGICNICARRVRDGIKDLQRINGKPYIHQEGYAPYVKTCQVTPTTNAVSIDADDRAFF